MSEKLQAFRWKGPGVLHIQRPSGERRVIPAYEAGQIEKACIVKENENLEALGGARITEFIKNGQAEPVNWVDGLAGMLKDDDPQSPALVDAKQADEIAQKAAKDSASVEKSAKAEKAAGNPKANAESAAVAAPSALPPTAGPKGEK